MKQAELSNAHELKREQRLRTETAD
jgi:hypothetical protein